jgi:hypothetical protein
LVVAQKLGGRNRERTTFSFQAPFRTLGARLLAIDPAETSFARRGFAPCSNATRARLEAHGAAFVRGFNLGLVHDPAREFDRAARDVPAAERGFAYEGAAMACALLDLLAPRRIRRLDALLADVGWALARLRRRPFGRLRLDPLLRWLAVDGFGFHEGFFRPDRFVRAMARHPRLRGYASRALDQGLGRSLWFVDAADPERIAATVSVFAPERRGDLWSGVGLAAAYAGAAGSGELERLRALASDHAAHAAQGAAFAAGARVRAGNLVPHVDLACELLCGLDARAAAGITDGALRTVRGGEAEDYERWRAEIRARLARA